MSKVRSNPFSSAGFSARAALCALAAVLGFVATAGAQTSAIGPYYATPSWDQTLPAATRFIVLTNFNSEAVLDRETGLVWERSPSASTDTWFNSLDACAMNAIGGRKGWRLPSVHELASLVDPATSNPALPAGHPFLTVQNAIYWSASIRVETAPWRVNLAAGTASFAGGTDGPLYRWCVRGGGSHNRDY